MKISQNTRHYLYTVAVAVGVLLVALGALTDVLADNILNVVFAALALGGNELARQNSGRDVAVVPTEPGIYDVDDL